MARRGEGSGEGLSRRELLAVASAYGGGLWLALAAPRATRAADPASRSGVLTGPERRALAALMERILPPGGEGDEGPGAVEAGCVGFVEGALAGPDARALPLYRQGLAGLDAAARHGHRKPFAALAPEQQDRLLAALAKGEAQGWPAGAVASPVFFETVRAHTLIGFLADPRYGGNRDHAGWKLCGYPGPRHHLGGYTPQQMLGEATIRSVWGQEL